MRITINNSLPSINSHLGLILVVEDCTCMRVDTSAMMNTGNRDYHLWTMSQCPTIDAEYMKCGPNTEYDVVQLLASLDLNVVYQPNTHGQMVAVVRYHTPYLVNDKDPLILSFVFGDNIYLRIILDLPTLLAMGAMIDLHHGTLACSERQHTFGNETSLDDSKPIVPPGVHSNIFSATSSLQFIAMDCFDFPVCQATLSNNIVVHYQFLQGSINRALTYKPSSLHTST